MCAVISFWKYKVARGLAVSGILKTASFFLFNQYYLSTNLFWFFHSYSSSHFLRGGWGRKQQK